MGGSDSKCKNKDFPQYDAGMCYPRCREGYNNAATVCWSHCPPNTTNLGGSCLAAAGFMEDRGIGKVANGCSGNDEAKRDKKEPKDWPEENHVGFCYPKCKEGEFRVVDRCYTDCPANKGTLFRNDGLFCGKRMYGNGFGYVSEEKCNENAGNGDLVDEDGKTLPDQKRGCFKCLSLWYPNCNKGMISGMEHGTGCNICRTKDCPSGFRDIGVSCTKPSYSTGIGRIADGCDYEADGEDRVFEDRMCYKRCPKGRVGTGVFCRMSCEPGKFNGTGCTRDTYDRGVGKMPAGALIGLIIAIIIFVLIIGIVLKIVKK